MKIRAEAKTECSGRCINGREIEAQGRGVQAHTIRARVVPTGARKNTAGPAERSHAPRSWRPAASLR